MKAISVKQPWARLFFEPPPALKDVENRGRRWSHRGPLVIQASQGWDADGAWFLRKVKRIKIPAKGAHAFGCLIGRVNMVGCVTEHPSKYFYGPFGYVFEEPRRFFTPIPWKGAQHPFDVPEAVVEAALAGGRHCAIEVGDTVRILGGNVRHRSYGSVTRVSECHRYAVVRNIHGRCWEEACFVEDLVKCSRPDWMEG